jgi:hypothetical protein
MPELFDYVESLADADELITEFAAGQVATLLRMVNSGTAYDPTQTPLTPAPTTPAVKIEFTAKQMASGNVLDTDERWLLAAGPLSAAGIVSLQSPDVLTVDGVDRPILIAKPLKPAGIVVMYDCHIRF